MTAKTVRVRVLLSRGGLQRGGIYNLPEDEARLLISEGVALPFNDAVPALKAEGDDGGAPEAVKGSKAQHDQGKPEQEDSSPTGGGGEASPKSDPPPKPKSGSKSKTATEPKANTEPLPSDDKDS